MPVISPQLASSTLHPGTPSSRPRGGKQPGHGHLQPRHVADLRVGAVASVWMHQARRGRRQSGDDPDQRRIRRARAKPHGRSWHPQRWHGTRPGESSPSRSRTRCPALEPREEPTRVAVVILAETSPRRHGEHEQASRSSSFAVSPDGLVVPNDHSG
jgi:hypothetical protein